jgi:hypothetical protein
VALLNIRPEQAEAFRQKSLSEFTAAAIVHLRRDLPEQTAAFSDAQLENRVQGCIPRAKAYGLVTSREVMCFVDVTYLLGENFDSDPDHEWAKTVLTSDNLPSADKGNLLLATACSVHSERSKKG